MATPTPDDIASDVRERSNTALKRGLASRHMQMIAIGGAIGTGLFLASGRTVSNAGPGGALLAYAAIGLMVLLLMQSLGEMSAHQPVAGSFQTFATKFISPSFGFAMGWNYWFNWAVTVAADLVASGLVMAYWFPSVPSWMWAVGFLVIVVGLNALSARVYGEAEFWLAAIKVVIVIIFVLSGVFMIAGVMGDNSPGLSNWTIGDAPFHNGFVGVIAVFMIAGFSFQGTELVGVAAGESENPRRDVPRSIRTVFWRIMFFYIGAIAVIGTLLPYTDPSLLRAADDSANNIAQSPFTLVFARMGIGAAAAVMNAVILTSILSAGNSGLYAASRMLHSMALKRQAPAIFARVTKGGVPAYAMAVTTVTLMQISQALVTIILLLLVMVIAGSSLSVSVPYGTILGVVALVMVAVGVIVAVPKVRRWIWSKIQPTWQQVYPRLLWIVGQPRRLAAVVGGNLLMNIGYVGSFWTALLAMGGSLNFSTVSLTYLTANAAGSFIPSPGGIGTVETALTSGLTVAGISSSVAIATALLYRLVTFYGRIPFGWLAMKYMEKRDLI